MKRRILIRNGALAGLGLLSQRCTPAAKVVASTPISPLTPPQTEGPFFPNQEQNDLDADLTQVESQEARATGEQVIVRVHLTDSNGNPIEQAMFDIWQACASGRYNHSDDTSSAPLDPNFQYWARLYTNSQGFLQFKTIIPGSYPASSDWDRPPHIHFQISIAEEEKLTSQMYFDGHPLNDIDRILNQTKVEYGEEAANNLVVDFSQRNEDGIGVGDFHIVLGLTPATE